MGLAQNKYRKTAKGIAAQSRAAENLLKKFPEYFRWNHIKKTYNISREDVIRQLEKQDWVCPVCKSLLILEAKGGQSIAIDHDHKCCDGRASCGLCVRGILHRECNAGIGKLKDDPAILRNAIEYLEQWKKE